MGIRATTSPSPSSAFTSTARRGCRSCFGHVEEEEPCLDRLRDAEELDLARDPVLVPEHELLGVRPAHPPEQRDGPTLVSAKPSTAERETEPASGERRRVDLDGAARERLVHHAPGLLRVEAREASQAHAELGARKLLCFRSAFANASCTTSRAVSASPVTDASMA